jgi:hypothetical protein
MINERHMSSYDGKSTAAVTQEVFWRENREKRGQSKLKTATL